MRELKHVDSLIINEIPSDWTWSKLKFVATISGRIGFRGYTVNDIVNEGEGAITLSPSNIEASKLVLNKKTFLSWDKYYESPEIMIEKNHIIFCKTGSSYGKSALIENVVEPMTLNPQLIVIKPFAVNPNFLAYLMESCFIKDQVETIVGGGTMPTISQENLLSMVVTLPNREEQLKIVSYLNKKASDIDSLIAIKLDQINLLKQQRQSIITEAVTKGLSPNVKMKDSGIEWVGEIPEHWISSPLKYYLDKLTDGSHFSPEIMDEGHPYITVKDLKSGYIDTKNAMKISTEDYLKLVNNGCKPECNDILLSKDGTIGKVAIVKENNFVILSSLAILRPNSKVYSDYLLYWLDSKVNKSQMESFLAGAALKRLTLQTIKKLIFILPPYNDQVEIVEYLNQRLDPINESISILYTQIEKLRKYRQTLIYEAVTGKIDVRNIEIN